MALKDLMERAVAAAADIERRAQADRALRAVTEKINSGLYLDEIADHVYESFRSLIPFDRIGLALLEQDDRVLRARWARAEYDVVGIRRGFCAPMAGSSLLAILQTRAPRIINDLEAYHAEHAASESTARIRSEGVLSSLTCPLVTAGRPVGFLFFSSLARDTYGAVHAQVFQEIANTLSVVVERAHMLERLAELNATLAARNGELRRANARVRRMTLTDPLTQTANRRGLMAALKMEASFATRHRVPLSVISFDVDHFKRVNDVHGHDVGDRALRHVARVARRVFRREDLVGRCGGEEFLVVLPATDEAQAARAAERARAKLAEASVPGLELRVTASFGVAERAPDESLDALLIRADRAMYAAKHSGRDAVVCASASPPQPQPCEAAAHTPGS